MVLVLYPFIAGFFVLPWNPHWLSGRKIAGDARTLPLGALAEIIPSTHRRWCANPNCFAMRAFGTPAPPGHGMRRCFSLGIGYVCLINTVLLCTCDAVSDALL
jgi:hypothetical protein